MTTEWFAHRSINWTWYANVTFVDNNTATLNVYDRLHHYRDTNHPEIAGTIVVLEYPDDRMAHAIDVTKDGICKRYSLTNPGHIFGFGKFTEDND